MRLPADRNTEVETLVYGEMLDPRAEAELSQTDHSAGLPKII